MPPQLLCPPVCSPLTTEELIVLVHKKGDFMSNAAILIIEGLWSSPAFYSVGHNNYGQSQPQKRRRKSHIEDVRLRHKEYAAWSI